MAKRKSLIVPILLLLALSCAKQEAPSGGPKDKTPPVIVETYPLNETVNFKDDKIKAVFSEYIDKSSARNAVFISPEVEKIKLDWSGKTLEIKFLDSLRANTTYTVTFGTDIKDLNEKNKMAEAFSLVFSTGNKIDKGEISGAVFDRKPEGVMIFAYKLADDSAAVNPYEQKPDYTTQSGKDGFYLLSGLAAARYALFAVRDVNSDKLYNDGEQIGFTSREIVLPNDSAKIGKVNFMLTVIDTVRPEADEITMTDGNHILAEYSETIDSSRLDAGNFFIIDSAANKTYPVKYVYKGKVKRQKILLSFDAPLNKDGRLFLSLGEVYDMRGNPSKKNVIEIFYNEKPDTAAPKLLGVSPAYGEKKINFRKPEFYLLFDDGVNLTSDALTFAEANGGDTLGFALKKINDAEFYVFPDKRLRSDSKYVLSVDFSRFSDAAGNSVDTVETFTLETIDEIDLVSVEGKIFLPEKFEKIYVELDNLKTAFSMQTVAQKNGAFKFESVPPGEYFVWAFDDANGNGKYDFGSLEPRRFSENFAFRGDTLKIRPRWPVKNVNFGF